MPPIAPVLDKSFELPSTVRFPGANFELSCSFEPRLFTAELTNFVTQVASLARSYVTPVEKVHDFFSIYRIQSESEVRKRLERLDIGNGPYQTLFNNTLRPAALPRLPECTSILEPNCAKDYIVIMPSMVQEKECDVTFVFREEGDKYVLLKLDVRTKFMGLKQELERMSIEKHTKCPNKTVRECEIGGSEAGCEVKPESVCLKSENQTEVGSKFRKDRDRLMALVEGWLQRMEKKIDAQKSSACLDIAPSDRLKATSRVENSYVPRIYWINGIHRPVFTFYKVVNIDGVESKLRSRDAFIGKRHANACLAFKKNGKIEASPVAKILRDEKDEFIDINAIVTTQLSVGWATVDVTLLAKKVEATNKYEIERVDVRPRNRFEQAKWVDSLRSKLKSSGGDRKGQRIEPLASVLADMASRESAGSNPCLKVEFNVTHNENRLYEGLKEVVSHLVRSEVTQKALTFDTEHAKRRSNAEVSGASSSDKHLRAT